MLLCGFLIYGSLVPFIVCVFYVGYTVILSLCCYSEVIWLFCAEPGLSIRLLLFLLEFGLL